MIKKFISTNEAVDKHELVEYSGSGSWMGTIAIRGEFCTDNTKIDGIMILICGTFHPQYPVGRIISKAHLKPNEWRPIKEKLILGNA